MGVWIAVDPLWVDRRLINGALPSGQRSIPTKRRLYTGRGRGGQRWFLSGEASAQARPVHLSTSLRQRLYLSTKKWTLIDVVIVRPEDLGICGVQYSGVWAAAEAMEAAPMTHAWSRVATRGREALIG